MTFRVVLLGKKVKSTYTFYLKKSNASSIHKNQESFFMFIEKNKYKIDLEQEIK